MQIRSSTAGDVEALLDIWRRSARATHAFLADAEITALAPDVRAYLAGSLATLSTLCLASGAPIGFMGVTESRVDSLFISPDHLRRGGGRLLLAHARRSGERLRVDVNEQNPEAIRFYEANGFVVVGRSALDDAGRPYPVLHMQEDPRPAGACAIQAQRAVSPPSTTS